MDDVITFDLKELLGELLRHQPQIDEIYIFGSRAYRTGSRRSDCDLLVRPAADGNVRSSDLRNFAMLRCPALDFFIAEGGRATSCMNDSFVRADSFEQLVSKLDAILLWSRAKGFSEFEFSFEAKWTFITNSDVIHVPTVLPNSHVSDLTWQNMIRRTEQNGLPVRPFIGDTIDKATSQIIEIAQRMVMYPKDLGQKGQAKNGWTVNILDEYDCQNLFYTVIKPWIPQLGREEVEIIYDRQKKISDFSLFQGRLIIELKHIGSDKDKREIVKTLDGLDRFYSQNPNVVCLLFLIYVDKAVSLDGAKWEKDHTFITKRPQVHTKIIRLP